MTIWSVVTPQLLIAATVVAIATVLPIATLGWLWSRRMFSLRASVLWTVAIVVLSLPAALAAIVVGNLAMHRTSRERLDLASS